jgi:hypothetical protein
MLRISITVTARPLNQSTQCPGPFFTENYEYRETGPKLTLPFNRRS